eukprot:TRINITY_DN36307_c0_g1_i2.p2 TRINITY_DN36307_c0_g1~~TRINITY_DN36307_c0_g1_i2.p2  ORF type:complete len:152 (-),score=51.49 TRINITY_DN36307_c0_g1_i2:157-612(-)
MYNQRHQFFFFFDFFFFSSRRRHTRCREVSWARRCVQETGYQRRVHGGGTNFDDVFSAFLTVFQCVTMEGWTDTQYILSKAFGPYAVIYFTPLVLIGAFFLVNFTLAVIKSRVSKLYEENRKMKEEARLNMLRNPDEMKNNAENKLSLIHI